MVCEGVLLTIRRQRTWMNSVVAKIAQVCSVDLQFTNCTSADACGTAQFIGCELDHLRRPVAVERRPESA